MGKYNQIKKEDYDTLFSDKKKQLQALKTALDTRKFEIELYWKRATYFWAFIASSFTGYFALMASKNFHQYSLLTALIAVMGFCFSLGWYFVNRGSKYWQENWEAHVGKLEEIKHGPLFKILLIPKHSKWQLLKSYPFSVSRINNVLSIITIIIWIILFFTSVFYEKTGRVLGCIQDLIKESPSCCVFIVSISFLGIVTAIMFCCSRSFLRDEIDPSSKNDWLRK